MKKFFSVATFNILAPCWKRIGVGGRFKLESSEPETWKNRMKQNILFAKSIGADVLNIQEYWFCEEMDRLFSEYLLDEYHGYQVKRTHHKDDGVCIFVKKDRFNIPNFKRVRYYGTGNRVGLLLHLTSKEEDDDFEFVVGTTHLTFPHHHYDEKILRKEQLNKLFSALEDFRKENDIEKNTPFVLSGDLNVLNPKGDVVLRIIEKEQKMESSYFNIHKSHDFISHLNHNGELMGCDFIFFERKEDLEIEDCFLYPKRVKDFKDYPTIKDGMSDHVPLVANFSYQSKKKKKKR